MPFTSGRNASGIRIEPFQTIKVLNPLVYWRMNEASSTVVSSGTLASRNANPTALTYSATKIPSRSPNTSISFNGTTSVGFIAGALVAGLLPTFSAGMWINTTTTAATSTLLMQQQSAGASGWYVQLINGVTVKFEGVNNALAFDFSVSGTLSSINDGGPVYIGVTVDSTYAYIFVNGIFINRSSVRVGGTYPSPFSWLGSSYGSSDFFAGTMSDVFVTAQLMTQTNHNNVYRNGMLNAVSPVGDNWGDAPTLAITGTTNPQTYDLTAASLEGNEPLSGTLPIRANQSIWRKFVVPALGHTYGTTYHISSSGYNNVIDLFLDVNGTMVGMTYVNGYIAFPTSSMRVNLTTVGATYYIRMSPYFDSATGSLTFDAYYTATPMPPSNDNFASAATISVVSSGSVAGTTVGSTLQDPNETYVFGTDGTIWYKFQADATGNITLDSQATSSVDAAVAVWAGVSGTVFGDLVLSSPDFSDNNSGTANSFLVTFAVTNGTWYYVQVSDYDGGAPITLSWSDIT